MPRFFARLPQRSFLAIMLAGSALITWASIPYFDFETLPPFAIEKLPVRFETLWLASLRLHVACALLAFPLCLLLMTRSLQRRPFWHRLLGRISGVVVLFGLVPSGVVLAFDAKGGKLVTVGFLLSAAIVAAGMGLGVAAARRRDFARHRRAMRHVVAQMSVAVSSRAMLIGLDMLGLDPDLSYVLALWMPVLLSAIVVELMSRPSTSPVTTLERNHREATSVTAVLRLRALFRPLPRLGR
ncbi:MAG TPA: DUF2306 domain-containing protein [Polyangiaceae bacterium]|nr:DUF2306 domain-containing protein [Polyangiaceae bacterium]